MADFFTLEPEDLEPEITRRPGRQSPLSTGLPPLADAPAPRRGTRDHPPAHAPCEACGKRVLVGLTASGQRLALDTHLATWLVDWDQGAPVPRLVASRGYPVHVCRR